MARFDSCYTHGFARVAAAIPRLRLADPRYNAEQTIELAERAASRHVALTVFPELGLVGYSTQDLFHQQPLVEAAAGFVGSRARPRPSACRRCWSSGCRCASATSCSTSPPSCTGAACSASSRRATCRTTASSTRSGTSARPVRPRSTRSLCSATTVPVRHRPPLRGRPTSPTSSCTWRSARTCGCRSRPAPTAAMAGATVVANLSGSNVTIGKAGYRQQLCSAQSARTIVGVRLRRRGRGRVDHRPRVGRPRHRRRERQPARRDASASRGDGSAHRPPTSTSIASSPTASGRRASSTASTTTATALRPPARPVRARPADDAGRRCGGAVGRGSRSCPRDPRERDERCAEVYAIQVQRPRHPAAGHRHRASSSSACRAGSTRPRRCSSRCGAWTTSACPATNVLAYTMPGFATSERTLGQRPPAHGGARRDRERDRHPPRGDADAARPRPPGRRRRAASTTSPTRTCRPARARRCCSAWPTSTAALVVGTGDLSRARARAGAPTAWATTCRTTASTARCPKTLIQYLVRWVADTERAGRRRPRRRSTRSSAPRSRRSWCRRRRPTRRAPAPAQRGRRRALRAAGLPPLPRAAVRLPAVEGRVPRAPRVGRPRPGRLAGARRSAERTEYDLPTICRWLRVFLRRFFHTSQFKRSALPDGPKVGSGGSLSPRGDWRAPSDATAAVWLAELDRAHRVARRPT